MTAAPLYQKLAQSPPGGTARWIEAHDGVRLRVAWWKGGTRGTVVIFQGRTESLEKYGRTVADFAALGFAVFAIDWRGQGLSDRLSTNRCLGHVGKFTDYQLDVEAMQVALERENLPRPWHILSHSMGGAIALRALQRGFPAQKAVFSAPMWGLTIEPKLRPLVQAIAAGTSSFGLGEEFAPGTSNDSYLETADFAENTLTSSRDSWDYMRAILSAHPGLKIGGPSINWLYEALCDNRELMTLAPPEVDAFALIGGDENVVDKRDVLGYMAKWPGAATVVQSGARHEILMETPEIRQRCLGMIASFLGE
ncbi:MAG: alpha/beta fold hydrolase [Paracoccaceae bacterium]